jgi:hypothetical protein
MSRKITAIGCQLQISDFRLQLVILSRDTQHAELSARYTETSGRPSHMLAA